MISAAQKDLTRILLTELQLARVHGDPAAAARRAREPVRDWPDAASIPAAVSAVCALAMAWRALDSQGARAASAQMDRALREALRAAWLWLDGAPVARAWMERELREAAHG